METKEMTKSEAMEIIAKAEERRLKKNASVREWRKKNATRHKEYMANWYAERKKQVEEAKKLLGQ